MLYVCIVNILVNNKSTIQQFCPETLLDVISTNRVLLISQHAFNWSDCNLE